MQLTKELHPTSLPAQDSLSVGLKSTLSLDAASAQTQVPSDQVDSDAPASNTLTVTDQAGFRVLVSSKHKELNSLNFRCGQISMKTIEQLVAGGWPALHSLNLASSKLLPTAMPLLVKGFWPSLTSLDLSNNALDEEALFVMADLGETLPKLEVLNLSFNQLNAGAMVHLIKPKFSKLQSPDLRHNNLDFMAVSEVIKGGWPDLKRIALSTNLTVDSCHLLIKEPTANKVEWPYLEHLDLSCNMLDASAMAKLTKGRWPWLNTLILFGNMLDADAMSKLSKAKWAHLKYLDLSGNPLGSGGIPKLTKGNFRKLEVLKLSDTNLGSSAISHLVKARWIKLLVADFSMNQIKGDAVTTLITAEWPLLETLNLSYNKLGDDVGVFAADKPTVWGKNTLDPPGCWNWPCLKMLDISRTHH